MIDFEALFSVTYGLYLVSSGDKRRGNGFISNTVMQVTAEPPMFATCCNKNNFTAEIMKSAGAFSVSVLHTEVPQDIISHFGYKSGRDIDKFNGMTIQYGVTGVPIILDGSMAFLECRIINTIDLGTHLMFIGELVQAGSIDGTKVPMTYKYYRETRKGVSPKNAPTYIDKAKIEKMVKQSGARQYKCTVCGYIYDENDEPVKFVNLPDDWVCPLCGAPKTDFEEVY